MFTKPKSKINRRYGHIPDAVDNRDVLYVPKLTEPEQLPPLVDLRPQCPPVYDQGQLGACTANAIAAAIQFDQMKQALPPFNPNPARLFIYWNERVSESTPGNDLTQCDSGAQIRDGMKSTATVGVCDESLWPYLIQKPFNTDVSVLPPQDNYPFTVKPSDAAYAAAAKCVAVVYSSLNQDLQTLKSCLAEGYPFVFGFKVYPTFESADVAATGIVPTPGIFYRMFNSSIGGHAVMCVGYDDSKQMFIVRNSWGNKWGISGYCYMTYDYLLSNLASDFWKIQAVS